MQPVKALLPQNLWQGLERKLGCEEALRLVWPAVVGPKMASQTRLVGLRGSTVILAVPDQGWKNSLESLEKMILDAVNGFSERARAARIELVVEVRPKVSTPAPPEYRAERNGSSMTTASATETIAAGAIGDLPLREFFVRSAQKYFARQQEPAK